MQAAPSSLRSLICLTRALRSHVPSLVAAALLIGLAGTARAEPYAPLDRLNAAELKHAVARMAERGHRPLGYRALWEVLAEADQHPSQAGHVIGIYSRTPIPTHCTEGKAPVGCGLTWNREHVWPKSKSFPRREQWAHTDAHHIAAEMVRCNALRGNLDFGEGGQENSTCASRRGKGAGATWEPSNESKGLVARMMFYVAVRYDGDPTGDKTPDLELVDRTTREGEPNLGRLCTLLRWHERFPVSQQERKRHEVVARWQGNRNPFVDRPELAQKIWGGTCGLR